ncbi:PorV/PorQ family protein [bacterium]|nr:PorV/PorQ family protein [bacterium]
MRVFTVALLGVLFVTSATFAGSAGTTGFELFRMDGFAKSSALGSSQIAVDGELHSFYSNPAGLAALDRPAGGVTYLKHVLDINLGTLVYARPFDKIGVLGLGITYFDYGSFDKADENGQKLGEFGASDVLFTAAASRKLRDDVLGGVSLKYLSSTIDDQSATAVALDAGVIYHTGYEGWNVGAGVYNVGTAMSAFINEKDALPTTYKLGFSVPLEHLPVEFSFGGCYTEAEGVEGAGGLEITFIEEIKGRVGYNTLGIDQHTGTSADGLAGFSGGIGLYFKNISVDYALTSMGEIGYLNRFTIASNL